MGHNLGELFKRSLSRREYMKIAALFGISLVSAACAPVPTTLPLSSPYRLPNSPGDPQPPDNPDPSKYKERQPWEKLEIYTMAAMIAGDGMSPEYFINGFKLKAPTEVTIGNANQTWAMVKEAKQGYEVLFNPTTNEWLKVAVNQGSVKRLKDSVDAMNASLEISGIHEWAKLINVQIGGKSFSAMLLKHLGPTLGVLLDNKATNRFAEAQAIEILNSAFENAVQLLQRGYFFADPNFNNIIRIYDEVSGKFKAILIDFTGNRLKAYPGLNNDKAIYLLFKHFADQAVKWSIPFNQSHMEAIFKRYNVDLPKSIIKAQQPGVPFTAINEMGNAVEVARVIPAEAKLNLVKDIPITEVTVTPGESEIGVGVSAVRTNILGSGAKFVEFLRSPLIQGVLGNSLKVLGFLGDVGMVMWAKETLDNRILHIQKGEFLTRKAEGMKSIELNTVIEQLIKFKLGVNSKFVEQPGFQRTGELANATLKVLSDWGMKEISKEAANAINIIWQAYKAQAYYGFVPLQLEGPGIASEKVDTGIMFLGRQDEAGSQIIVIRRPPDNMSWDSEDFVKNYLLFNLRQDLNTKKWTSVSTVAGKPATITYKFMIPASGIGPIETRKQKDCQMVLTDDKIDLFFN